MNKSLKSIKGIMAVIVLIALMIPNFVGLAQGSAPDFFSDADGSSADAAYAKPVQVMRTRYVNVNIGLLLDSSGKALDASAAPEITFNLFADANFTGVVTRIEKNPGVSTSWIGRLKGVENSYFYVVRADNAVIVHVGSPLGIYEVSMVKDGLYRVVQLDQTKFGEDAPGQMAEPGPVLSAADVKNLGPTADSGATIDVMVLYTTTTRVAEGSVAAMKARIALAVSETNTGYLNAGITPRLRLVHVEEVAYTESGDIGVDVARLAGTSDGYIDSIHTLRNIYAADMVSMIVENGGGYCGIADAIMATAATAFDVTARSCATGYYSFGHEFGHLQGARHDTYVDSTNSPFSYGHGYLHPSATAAQSWRTIMGYNNGCSDFGYNCTRLQYWSNPTKTYSGAAMGVAGTSENYKVLNATAATVANFRSSIIGNNFISTFDASSAGWTPVYGSWALYGSAYYRTLGVAGMGSSIKYASTYGDLTYTVRMKRTGSTLGSANRLIIRGNPLSLGATKSWNSSYAFQYSNDGYFSVYYYNASGTATALKAWTTSAAIVQNGFNTLKVVAVGSSLKFYINNTLVWSGTNTALKTGKVGVGMYRDSASTGNAFYVDSATLSTTPTADTNPNETVADGVEVSGGTVDQSPAP